MRVILKWEIPEPIANGKDPVERGLKEQGNQWYKILERAGRWKIKYPPSHPLVFSTIKQLNYKFSVFNRYICLCALWP